MMEQSLPPWLTKAFLTEVLKKEEETEDIIVTDFTTSAAVPPGNNYGSCLYRVRTEYRVGQNKDQTNHISLILKSELAEGVFKESFSDLYVSENLFYNTFVPEGRKLADLSFIPQSLYSPIPNVVILEDLKEKGYKMADRRNRLDFDHCKLYIVSAAALHAVSVAVKKIEPAVLQFMRNESLFSKASKGAEMFKAQISKGVKCLRDKIKNIDRFKQHCTIINKITPENLWNMLVEAHEPRDVVNTLDQGDPWITNMMFKYDDEGKVCGIKLLDFQGPTYGSPVNDIMFFIWSSANHDVRKHRLDELYHLYVDCFNGKLKDLKCAERLSYAEFMENVKRLSPLALHMVTALGPFLHDPDPVDFSEFLKPESEGSENPYQRLYSDDYCTNVFPDLLEDLETTGVFDYMREHLNLSEECK